MIHVCYVDAKFAIWAKEQVNGSLHTVLHAALLAYAGRISQTLPMSYPTSSCAPLPELDSRDASPEVHTSSTRHTTAAESQHGRVRCRFAHGKLLLITADKLLIKADKRGNSMIKVTNTN